MSSGASKFLDTVRARKGSGVSASTQRYLSIAEIKNDTILLKNGGMRAVLAIEAINFNLKSEVEQKAIIAGYGSFVNTLTFPIQIIVRSTKTNIDEYLQNLHAIENTQQNELLKTQTGAYLAFMERLVSIADIMQKRFFVVVPFDHSLRHKTKVEQFFDWMSPDDSSGKALQRSKEFYRGSKLLGERVDLVSSGLTNIGLHIRRLPTRDLIEVFYQIYNPKTAQTQKLPKNEEELNLEEAAL